MAQLQRPATRLQQFCWGGFAFIALNIAVQVLFVGSLRAAATAVGSASALLVLLVSLLVATSREPGMLVLTSLKIFLSYHVHVFALIITLLVIGQVKVPGPFQGVDLPNWFGSVLIGALGGIIGMVVSVPFWRSSWIFRNSTDQCFSLGHFLVGLLGGGILLVIGH